MFIKNGKLIIVKRRTIDDRPEPWMIYIERCRFIISQKIKNDNEYLTIENLSMFYSNYKCYGCTYSKEVMDKINLLKENISSFN